MKIIIMSNGITQVSDEDHYWLLAYTWYINSMGYPVTTINKISMHKLIAERMGLKGTVDHKDRNKLNNQRENLREATVNDNVRNKTSDKNKTGYRGVAYIRETGKYKSCISIDSKNYHLGTFELAADAAQAYDDAAKKYFGEFAVLNFG